MQYLLFVLLLLAATFGVCFLADKLFHKLFRNRQEQKTGKAVLLNKKLAVAGLLLAVLGVSAILSGINGEKIMLFAGIVLVLTGIGLTVYYITFGIYYDVDTFLVCGFGRKPARYHYSDISSQGLYTSAGGTLVELYLHDGKSVGLQASMEGVYPFLDHAFDVWCRQRGISPEDCPFHKPDESCWFPSGEES